MGLVRGFEAERKRSEEGVAEESYGGCRMMSMSLESEWLICGGNRWLFRVILSSHLSLSLESLVREHSFSMCHSSCIRGSAKGKLHNRSMLSGEQQLSQYRCDLGMPLCRPVSILSR